MNITWCDPPFYKKQSPHRLEQASHIRFRSTQRVAPPTSLRGPGERKPFAPRQLRAKIGTEMKQPLSLKLDEKSHLNKTTTSHSSVTGDRVEEMQAMEESERSLAEQPSPVGRNIAISNLDSHLDTNQSKEIQYPLMRKPLWIPADFDRILESSPSDHLKQESLMISARVKSSIAGSEITSM